MKIKLNSQIKVLEAIAKFNSLLGLPDGNGTETYCGVPELTETENESYYELEISSELSQLIVEKFATDFEVAEKLDIVMPKRYKVRATNKEWNKFVVAFPALLDYLSQSKIVIDFDTEDGFASFEVNAILPEHRALLEGYLGTESITDRQNGNE